MITGKIRQEAIAVREFMHQFIAFVNDSLNLPVFLAIEQEHLAGGPAPCLGQLD